MKRKVTWAAESRIVPALRRVVADGAVKMGDDISGAPPEILTQLIGQGLAEEQVPSAKAAAAKTAPSTKNVGRGKPSLASAPAPAKQEPPSKSDT